MKSGYSVVVTVWKAVCAAFWPSAVIFLANLSDKIQVDFKDAIWLPIALAAIAAAGNIIHQRAK